MIGYACGLREVLKGYLLLDGFKSVYKILYGSGIDRKAASYKLEIDLGGHAEPDLLNLSGAGDVLFINDCIGKILFPDQCCLLVDAALFGKVSHVRALSGSQGTCTGTGRPFGGDGELYFRNVLSLENVFSGDGKVSFKEPFCDGKPFPGIVKNLPGFDHAIFYILHLGRIENGSIRDLCGSFGCGTLGNVKTPYRKRKVVFDDICFFGIGGSFELRSQIDRI